MPTRLFVLLQHGSHGSTDDFVVLRTSLEERAAAEGIDMRIFETNVNATLKSDHGTVTCATRLLAELLPAYDAWVTSGSAVMGTAINLFSSVSHSFGGLIVREALPAIWQHPATARGGVRFSTFISIASPHCGVRCSLVPIMLLGARLIGPVYSTTYQDLTLDTPVLTTRLVDDEHLAALAAFDQCVLFSNTTNDFLVSLETSSCVFEGDDAHHSIITEAAATPSGGDPRTPHLLTPRVIVRSADEPTRRGLMDAAAGSSIWRYVRPLFFRDTSDAASRAIAAKLRSSRDFVVVPIRSKSILPTAHNASIRSLPLIPVMRDVIDDVTDRILAPARR